MDEKQRLIIETSHETAKSLQESLDMLQMSLQEEERTDEEKLYFYKQTIENISLYSTALLGGLNMLMKVSGVEES